MIDCNITKNYIQERKRMCESYSCFECPLSSKKNGTKKTCRVFENYYPDKVIEIVQKWSDEHPQKTLLTEFLKHYPKTELNGMGIPDIAPCKLGLVELNSKCIENCVHQYCIGLPCKDCWNTHVGESEE